MIFHILYKWLAILWYLTTLIFVIIGLPFYLLYSTAIIFKEELQWLTKHFIREYKELKALIPAPYRDNVKPSLSWKKIKDAFFYTLQ